MQAWLAAQTGARSRFADEPMRTAWLPETDARIADRGPHVRDRIERRLRRQGFHEPRTLGVASRIPDEDLREPMDTHRRRARILLM